MKKSLIILLSFVVFACSSTRKSPNDLKETLSSYFDSEEYVTEENGDQTMILYYATTNKSGKFETIFMTRNLTNGNLYKGSFTGSSIGWFDVNSLLIEEMLGLADEKSNGKRSYSLNLETGEKKLVSSE